MIKDTIKRYLPEGTCIYMSCGTHTCGTCTCCTCNNNNNKSLTGMLKIYVATTTETMLFSNLP